MKKYNKYKETVLIRLIRKKNQHHDAAFLELYNRYSKALMAYCISIQFNRAEAQELFEQTMIDFYKAIMNGNQPESCLAYIIAIARKKLAGMIQFRKKEKEKFSGISIENLDQISNSDILTDRHIKPEYEREFENRELLELIQNALNLLNEEERIIYTMNKFNGCSAKQIAEALQLNVNYVKSKIYRTQIKIKKILQPYIAELQREK